MKMWSVVIFRSLETRDGKGSAQTEIKLPFVPCVGLTLGLEKLHDGSHAVITSVKWNVAEKYFSCGLKGHYALEAWDDLAAVYAGAGWKVRQWLSSPAAGPAEAPTDGDDADASPDAGPG